MTQLSPDTPRLAEYQLTREEAIQFAAQGRWETMTPLERGVFQMRQECLCMPFEKVQEGVTEMLGRPVYTHEFANGDLLWDEYLGKVPKADFETILAKLPSHLQIVVAVVKDDDGA